MGAPHDAFVPAAVLFENPGITLDVFDRKLRRIGYFRDSSNYIFGWNNINSSVMAYRSGIISILKTILCYDGDFSALNPQTEDPWKINPLEVIRRPGKRSWITPEYRVNTFLGKRYASPEIRTGAKYGDSPVGSEIKWIGESRSYFYLNDELQEVKDVSGRDNTFRVEERLSEEIRNVSGQDIPFVTTRLSRVIPCYRQERFASLNGLVEDHPRFSPSSLLDLNKQRGKFSVKDPFFFYLDWFKVGDGYHLDLKSLFEKGSPCSKASSDSIYTSIVLTAEAIKHREWEMIASASGDERPGIIAEFFIAHPSSKRRHDNHLIQFWDSKDAYTRSLTNNEWLRERALEQWRKGLTPAQAKTEYKLVCEEAPDKIRAMNSRRDREMRALTNQTRVDIDSNEPLF